MVIVCLDERGIPIIMDFHVFKCVQISDIFIAYPIILMHTSIIRNKHPKYV